METGRRGKGDGEQNIVYMKQKRPQHQEEKKSEAIDVFWGENY